MAVATGRLRLLFEPHTSGAIKIAPYTSSMSREPTLILKHLFLRPEILSRLIFSNEDGQAYYVQATSRQQARRAHPEEIIRQLFVLSLLHDYKYPEGLIRLEYPIQMGSARKRADIAVLDTGGIVKMIIEVKAGHDKDAMEQLNSYMAITGAMYGAIISSTEITCIRRLSAQDVLPINDLPVFLENDTWSEPVIQTLHNQQPSMSTIQGETIEVDGFERSTRTHVKITIKGHTLRLSNVELESYKKLRQKFLTAGIALNPNIKQAEWFRKFSQLLESTPIANTPNRSGGVGAEKPVLEAVEEAIKQGLPGFAGDWISSSALDSLLKRIRADHVFPRNKRRELLTSIGYDWHPGLTNGRVNNVLPDGSKPNLFIKTGHWASELRGGGVIAKAYQEAQAGNGPQEVPAMTVFGRVAE